MKFVFLSNYLNHHQLPFCLEMVRATGNEFTFIATTTISDERMKLGYEDMNKKYDFVFCAYDSEKAKKEARKLCTECDVLMFSSGNEPKYYYSVRLRKGKLTFRVSERIFKSDSNRNKMFLRKIKAFFESGLYKNFYLLCNGAFVYSDYAELGVFKNKAYKFGYFPNVMLYNDINDVVSSKKHHSILWAGRFIDWKHSDDVIGLSRKLNEAGYDFDVTMIGYGELEADLKEKVRSCNLDGRIHFLGSMTPDEVRKNMEATEIYLFTSDKREGWGAVLNEAMNSACAVVASDEIGAVPFLIKNRENGLVYQSGNVDDLFCKVKLLLDDEALRKRLSLSAYRTMTEMWNPQNAAQRLVALASELIKDEHKSFIFEDGVCSKAEIVKEEWFRS